MKKEMIVVVMLLGCLACDDLQPEPNATPTVEAVGQYCLDNIQSAQACVSSGEDPSYCIIVEGRDPELHWGWSAYYECIVNTCIGTTNEEFSVCIENELFDNANTTQCKETFSLCELMGSASIYWAE